MRRIPVGALWVSLAVVSAAFAGDLKEPNAVKSALSRLVHEYGDMGRKVTTERYARLPHDNQEFQEEADAVRAAVATEPAEFKAKVESALAEALAASAHVAEVGATHDQGLVKSALDGLGNSLRSLNALFPQGVRAEVAD
jgi:hypothetical protein